MSEHERGQHALLSPSSAERWATCPASVRLAQSLPEPPESPYAAEGTAMHELAEVQARFVLLGTMTSEEHEQRLDSWRRDHGAAITDEREMFRYAREYVDLLRGLLREEGDNAVLFLEQRLPTGVPSCWGTSDAVIVSPRRVTIVDLKYGMGVRVAALDNPQLRLYGVGALETLGDMIGDIEEVRVMVYQPRLDHFEGETLTADDLRAWRDSMIPKAELALAGVEGQDVPFGPSVDACRWCPAAGNCEAQLRHETSLDFGALEPASGVLTPDMIAEVLPRLDGIEAWIKAVREHALYLAYNADTPIPGHKVVMTNGKRYIADEGAALAALEKAGHAREEVTNTKIKGIGDLTKIGALEVIEPFIGKQDGKPALVPEEDGRPAINQAGQAAIDFMV